MNKGKKWNVRSLIFFLNYKKKDIIIMPCPRFVLAAGKLGPSKRERFPCEILNKENKEIILIYWLEKNKKNKAAARAKTGDFI